MRRFIAGDNGLIEVDENRCSLLYHALRDGTSIRRGDWVGIRDNKIINLSEEAFANAISGVYL